MKIVVVGSINIDLVTEATRFPKVGETIIGNRFSTFFGGKGSNQAVCASRLGAHVAFIGCVGEDDNGIGAIGNLKQNGVNCDAVKIVKDISTGIAQITIAEKDNSIIIVKGANDKVTESMVSGYKDVLSEADLVLLQLEIPLKTVEWIVDFCKKRNIVTVLNPAPAMPLPIELINNVSYLTPNEVEHQIIFNQNETDTLMKYPNKLIITKGASGVDYFDGTEIVRVEAHDVMVTDTTGAGDSFNGAFCVGIMNGLTTLEAIKFGNQIAAKTVQKLGAQTAMPFLKDL